MTHYCSDCANWNLRDSKMSSAGLGICKQNKQAGHYVSGTFPRECDKFKQAEPKVIELRMRLLQE